jgi:hypothetical protein
MFALSGVFRWCRGYDGRASKVQIEEDLRF